MRIKTLFIAALLIASSCKRGDGDTSATGRFEADETVISAEYPGKIIELYAAEGAKVIAGDVLAVTDTIQLYLQRARLIASFEAVKARKTDIDKQTAAVKQQIEYLSRERERAHRLLVAGAGNAKPVDDFDSQILTLKKQLEAQISAIVNGNMSADREAEALKVQIAQTDEMLKSSRIKSPLSGTIIVKYISNGEIAAPGKPLFRIANLEKMTLKAYVGAKQLSMVAVGDTVDVETGFDEQTTRKYTGVITWISQEAEFTPKSVQTRDERSNLVYAVKVSVKNDGFLKSGMYGDLKFRGRS